METKLCEKCGEAVGINKAFCPACGNAFDEEQKREASAYDAMDSTVQLGNTMYGQMLADMGLNISRAPDAPEKKVEVLAPVAAPAPEPPAPAPAPAAPTPSPAPVAPRAAEPTPSPATAERPVSERSGLSLRWYIIGGIVLLFLFLIVFAAAVLFFMFGPRFI